MVHLIHKKEKHEPMAKAEPEDTFVEMSKGERVRKMRDELKKGKEVYLAPVEDRESFRKRILSMSLFPNLMNRDYLLKHMQ